MGFLCKLVSVIRVLQRSFRMPVCRCAIAFFVVFGSRTMGLRRKFVLLCGFSVCLVHGIFSWERNNPPASARGTPISSLILKWARRGAFRLVLCRNLRNRFRGKPPSANSAFAVAGSAPSRRDTWFQRTWLAASRMFSRNRRWRCACNGSPDRWSPRSAATIIAFGRRHTAVNV